MPNMDLDLSTRDDIAALLHTLDTPLKRGGRTRSALKAEQAREQLRRRAGVPKSRERCRCGSCPSCQEDARWDRIFTEKVRGPDILRRTTAVAGLAAGHAVSRRRRFARSIRYTTPFSRTLWTSRCTG
jgi:hypothetical protein